MDVFTREWTYRSPLVTVTYPKGWSGTLPPERQLAARRAKVLVPPPRRETADGRKRAATPRAPRRARQAQS
jgi:hypothetical protein